MIFEVAELICQHRLDFRLENFFGIYFVGQNAQSRKCYWLCRPKKDPLILELPDKDDLKDVLVVGGNWEFGPGETDRTPVPRAKNEAFSKRFTLYYFSAVGLFIWINC